MRDLDKMQEKTALMLDSRHVFFLFFGGSVAAVLLFSLGVIVGRSLPAQENLDGEDPLALLDELGAEQETLSFQRGLRGRSAPPVVRPRATKPAKREAAAARQASKPLETDAPSAKAGAAPSPPSAPAKASPEPSGRFTLQLSSFQEKEEADEFVKMLKQKGYETYVVAADVPGRGLWYRVRLGAYDSHQQAIEAKAEFERKQHIIAYVLRN